jgi:hypothetical protein
MHVVGPHSMPSSATALEGCAAHLRHLAHSHTAAVILASRYKFSDADAKAIGRLLSAHVGRGMDFFEAAKSVPRGVRPLLHYYAYLNLAVACVLAYRPKNWSRYRSHGLSDLTGRFRSVGLRSRVLRTGDGAVTKFHDVVCGIRLTAEPINILEMLVPIPWISTELSDAFKIKTITVAVRQQVVPAEDKGLPHTSIRFMIEGGSGGLTEAEAAPHLEPFLKSFPLLRDAFSPWSQQPQGADFLSRSPLPEDELEKQETHSRLCLPLINFGGHTRWNQPGQYRWIIAPRCRPLPCLTAAMMFSFFLASAVRYRPALTHRMAQSSLNLLIEVFLAEAPHYLMPVFRNLLYREEMVFATMPAV